MDTDTVLIIFGLLVGGTPVIYGAIKYAADWIIKKQKKKGAQELQETRKEYDEIIGEIFSEITWIRGDYDLVPVDETNLINEFVKKLVMNIKSGKINLEYLEEILKEER